LLVSGKIAYIFAGIGKISPNFCLVSVLSHRLKVRAAPAREAEQLCHPVTAPPNSQGKKKITPTSQGGQKKLPPPHRGGKPHLSGGANSPAKRVPAPDMLFAVPHCIRFGYPPWFALAPG
jgi:hypothetical protein